MLCGSRYDVSLSADSSDSISGVKQQTSIFHPSPSRSSFSLESSSLMMFPFIKYKRVVILFLLRNGPTSQCREFMAEVQRFEAAPMTQVASSLLASPVTRWTPCVVPMSDTLGQNISLCYKACRWYFQCQNDVGVSALPEYWTGIKTRSEQCFLVLRILDAGPSEATYTGSYSTRRGGMLTTGCPGS